MRGVLAIRRPYLVGFHSHLALSVVVFDVIRGAAQTDTRNDAGAVVPPAFEVGLDLGAHRMSVTALGR